MTKTHTHTIRIYYQNTDAGGVTYHAQYANFAEQARCEFLRDNGKSIIELKQKNNIILVVKKLTIEFIKPTYLDEEITIQSYITQIGKASFTMQQNFLRNKNKLTNAEVTLVAVTNENDNFKPTPIPESLKNILTPYHH